MANYFHFNILHSIQKVYDSTTILLLTYNLLLEF